MAPHTTQVSQVGVHEADLDEMLSPRGAAGARPALDAVLFRSRRVRSRRSANAVVVHSALSLYR